MSEHADRFDPREYIPNLPRRPGVYRMYSSRRDGKASCSTWARRAACAIASATISSPATSIPKVQALVGHIARIEVTLTNSETEALLLEYNLIKEHKPRYNIVLRDDKSFPYIYLPSGHEYPRLVFYRGARNLPGRYFGPFPSAGAVKETLQSVQKIFRIRNCRDTFFENRSRPCLQHQIGRCSAPCVKLISREDYARDIAAAVKVLEGPQRRSVRRARARHGAGRRTACNTSAPRRCAISSPRSSRCRPSRSSPPRAIATSTCSRWSASRASSRSR